MYPVLLQHLLCLFRPVHAEDHDGIVVDPAQMGIEIMDVDARVHERFQYRVNSARMVRCFNGKDISHFGAVAVSLENIERLFRIIDNKTDGADIGGIGDGDGPDIDPFPAQ